ncbi:PD-(D/E)XK nuclease superfamily protein [Amycolatopsis tolypomycina]|uniref:PD-(D/E)XK nuclease superfamily protein n=1 Tax=Amycolatopsis tolypomycina TaxID=208445 RepID=A0A1H4JHR0_9PSEU|nr:PD-(D/E)XK nuclease superfamily protein [Amycolatopsis tolypomycina]
MAAGAGRGGEWTCPSSLGWKSRPRAASVSRFPYEHLDDFVLRPVMAALDKVEFDKSSADEALAEVQRRGKPTHPGVSRFAEHATRMYLASHQQRDDTMRPVREFWVAQRITTSVVWELYGWGRRYESTDGRLREFRFLRLGAVDSRDRDPAEIALAAYAAAFGAPAAWPDPWSQPFSPSGRAGAERVRVVDVGLLDGSTVQCFDGTADEVEEYFAEHGRRQVSTIVAGSDAVPGSGCASCKRVTVCDGPVRTPGLLGLEASQGPLRTVSISGLRYYRKCPAQAYLRSVHLPRAYEYSAEAELGQAVHAWLEAAHEAQLVPCGRDDLPALGSSWFAGKWYVAAGDLADAGIRMLAHHVEVCPFREAPEIDSVQVEPRLTFADTTARAIVLARPDLVYREAGQWVWRELKTTQKAPESFGDPLRKFPQLALGVAVLAAGGLGPGGAGRVELEILRPTGAEIVLIDPTDDERVETARAVLREWAAAWRADHSFEARAGRNCRWCPVSLWCPSYPGPDGNGKDHPSGAASATAAES